MSKIKILFVIFALICISPTVAKDNQVCIGANCKEKCDCYWSADCSGKKTCDYGSGCTHSGKLDGTCSTSSSPTTPLSDLDLDSIANTLDLLFEAYSKPTRKEGLPDQGVVQKLQNSKISKNDQHIIMSAVFNAIDVTLGFDFAHPREKCLAINERCFGIFRVTPDKEGFILLNEVRKGFQQSILTRNPEAIAKSLNEFWKRYPKFVPHHLGRCYPHGHNEELGERSAQKCQVDELSRIIDELLTSRKKYNSIY